MPKLSSYIKSIIPSTKSIRMLPHWQNLLPISPKDQHEIATQVIPRVGANNWGNNSNTNLELLQKYYDCHDLVHSCIDLVSSTFALAKLKVKKYDTKTNKYTYVPSHPLQTLLDNPNSSMGGYDLRQAYIVHRLLFGTMACILLRGHMTLSTQEANACPSCRKLEPGDCPHILWHFHTGPITQIMPVHLDRLDKMKVDTPRGEREYFIYDLGDGVKRLVHPDNIMTDPNYNPGGSFYGTSPTGMVQRWLEIDLGMSKQIGAYLLNNAIPSMILNLKPPKFTNDQGGRMEDPSGLLEKMKEKWMKDFSMTGSDNGYGEKVKTPAFVYGDLEILRVQDTIKDIVQKPLFYEIENRIAMAYKVPRSFFEFGLDYGSQGSTAKQQNEDFFNFAISPQLLSFKSKIERYVIPSYNDPTLEVEWDLGAMGIASFLEDNRKIHILKVWELGLDTRDSVREKLGMDPLGGEFGDDLYRIDVLGTGNESSNGSTAGRVSSNSADDNIRKPNPEMTQQLIGKPQNEDY